MFKGDSMKKGFNFGLIFCLFLFGCASQTFKPVTTETVKKAPRLSKNQIFDKAMKWFSTEFVNNEKKIERADKKKGTIIASGSAFLSGKLIKKMMEFQIRVDIKRGRYKISTTIMKYKDEISKGIFRVPTATKDRISSGNQYTKNMSKSLHKFIVKRDKKW